MTKSKVFLVVMLIAYAAGFGVRLCCLSDDCYCCITAQEVEAAPEASVVNSCCPKCELKSEVEEKQTPQKKNPDKGKACGAEFLPGIWLWRQFFLFYTAPINFRT